MADRWTVYLRMGTFRVIYSPDLIGDQYRVERRVKRNRRIHWRTVSSGPGREGLIEEAKEQHAKRVPA